jgi:tetratricopeptide (TPR) repeat protein
MKTARILRREALPRGKLYIITGGSTFSAAPNFIGQMLKQTSAITVGDIASGPLNWCSDVLGFVLPNSGLDVQISTMFWMTGHPMDKRGCYPPDYYLPQSFKDYVSWADKPLESILAGQALPLKDILVNQGWEKFKAEFDKRKSLYPDVGNWFPYTPFDLVLTAYFDLLGAGKGSDALELAKFNLLLHPDDLRSLYGLAEIANEQGNTNLALPAYEKLLALEPHLADTRKLYHGLLLMKAFDEKGSEALSALFKELSKSSPQTVNENVLNNLGYRKFSREQTAAALEIFRLNVALHPDYANGYDSLGEACVRAGDRENAIRAYQKALELDPRMMSAKEALEKLLEKKR